MAGGWPNGPEVVNATDQGTVTASSQGTAVISSSTTNTYGSWTQLIASSAIDCCFVMVQVSCPTGVAAGNVVDIGVGASGSEKVIISAIQVLSTVSSSFVGGMTTVVFPCQIVTGTRIAARSQSSTASTTMYVSVILFDGAYTQGEGASGVVDTYGFVSTTTLGTAIDPGATVNTKGSYVQITASTTSDLAGFILVFDMQGQENTTVDYEALIDIATGASGSEKVLIPNMPFTGNLATGPWQPGMNPEATEFIPIAIPASTRVAIRAQSSANTATARVFGVTMYGVRM